MNTYIRTALGIAGTTLLAVLEAVMLIATLIGLTTTLDDAREKFPPFIFWLLSTPWWVPALLIPTLLAAVVAWSYWPALNNQKRLDEQAEATKSALSKAWEFRSSFATYKDCADAKKDQIEASIANIHAILGSVSQQSNSNQETLQNRQYDHAHFVNEVNVKLSDFQNSIGFCEQTGQESLRRVDEIGTQLTERMVMEISARLDAFREEFKDTLANHETRIGWIEHPPEEKS